jgi:hypothetical protein
MRHRWFAFAVLAVPVVALVSLADRAPEDRADATHVVVGVVEDVYSQEGAKGANRGHVVAIAIEKVERGEGLKAGDTFYASCYRPNPNAPDLKKLTEKQQKEYLFTVDGGYNLVPKAGDRVRVFVRHHRGKYAGIFPDWVDVLQDK